MYIDKMCTRNVMTGQNMNNDTRKTKTLLFVFVLLWCCKEKKTHTHTQKKRNLKINQNILIYFPKSSTSKCNKNKERKQQQENKFHKFIIVSTCELKVCICVRSYVHCIWECVYGSMILWTCSLTYVHICMPMCVCICL